MGASFPKSAEAAQWWEYWFKVPARATDGDTAALTCGWHTDCTIAATGDSLDWGGNQPSPADWGVYLRGAGKRASSSTSVGSWAEPRWASQELGSSCTYMVIVDVYNGSTGAWQVSLVYKHVGTGGPLDNAQVFMRYNSAGYSLAGTRVAGMAGQTADVPACHTTGEHVHASIYCCSPITPSVNTSGFSSSHSFPSPFYAPTNNLSWVQYMTWYY